MESEKDKANRAALEIRLLVQGSHGEVLREDPKRRKEFARRESQKEMRNIG